MAPLTDEPLPVIIIGTGMEARLATDVLALTGQVVYGYLMTDKPTGERPEEINDVTVLGMWTDAPYQKMLLNEKMDYFIAEGNLQRRKALFDELFKLLNRLPLNIAHPYAAVSIHADLAQGNLVCAGAVLSPNMKAEACNVFMPGCVVEPDAVLGSFSTYGSGCRIGAKAVVGDSVVVGAGAILLPNVQVEDGAVIGAGSVVTKTVRAGEVVFGVPAQVMKEGV